MPSPAAQNIARWWDHPDIFVREVFGIIPDPWQDESLKAFPTSPRLALKAPICLEAIVPTPLGNRRWGDVSIDDELFAEDGTPTRVLRRFDVRTQLYRVYFRDGTSLRVSADHEWDVQTPYDRKIGARRTVKTAELASIPLRNSCGQRLISIPRQGAAQFAEANLPAEPYLFGLWLGDGIANEPRLICPDLAIRDVLRSRGHKITESTSIPKRIGVTGWIGSLRETGMSACRSFEKGIPDLYKFSSPAQRLDLLRGLMDSDGTCAKNGHCYLASCSEALIDDFMWLARSLGFSSTKLGPYKINGGLNRDSYRAVICGDMCPFLAETKKRKRWRAPRKGKANRFIERIVSDGVGDAMCVEINSPSHCFQATDFIVTHNCKGPGKTAVLAWIGWNFLLTRPHPMCGATSISGDNLKANLWTELARWHAKSPLLQHVFEMTKTEIFAREHPKTWKMEARTWAKDANAAQIGNALAGIHAEYVLWLLDESGDYPDAIMPTCEGIFAGNPIEAHIVQAGNPTRLSGPLYRACTVARALWKVIEITGDPDDPNRSPRIPIEHAREQIRQYGIDNPWVLVNIFGRFPPASFNALLGPDDVMQAFGRKYQAHDIVNAARILGVDVAREGDDASVIFPRQGLVAFKPHVMRNVTSLTGAGQVARVWEDWKVEAVFVDNTGGFGAGWIDQLSVLNRSAIPVGFAESARDKRYFNRRAEMYFLMAQWVKAGGALPDVPDLVAELTQTHYTFKGDALMLEPKDIIKKNIGRSPDLADALALTFADPVASKNVRELLPKGRAETEYDPFAAYTR